MVRLLVVDDDPHVRELVAKLAYRLVGNAVEVVAAADAAEALALQQAGPCDALLTDYFMPEVDGPDLIRRLTFYQPKLRTLLMTGDATRVGQRIGPGNIPVRDKADLEAVVEEAVGLALEGL